MTVELETIQKGDTDGVAKIQANFEAINGALPDVKIAEWQSLKPYLTPAWTESGADSPLQYKLDGSGVWIRGDIKAVKAIAADTDSVVYQGLPFTFDGKQKSGQWAVGADGFVLAVYGTNTISFTRYHNGDGTSKGVNAANSFAVNAYLAVK